MQKYDLDTLRHSTAHLMAQAVGELFPDEKVQLGIGPTIEDGFYYDIDIETKITEEHLTQIENKMKQLIKADLPITRREIDRQEAIALFEKMGQSLKVELIRDLPDDAVISIYTNGDKFFDLCRGPHVERTSHLNHFFKLMHTAGAYWRGDQSRKMLQRIYAACFDSKEDLKNHLTFLEEAKKRDHRKLGKELDLFVFDPVAPGSPFFMPKGTQIYNELLAFIRRIYSKYNYKEVITPQVLDVSLWHTSGHYENYKENMFFSQIDEREYAVKPMNCPCHMVMYKHGQYSYRDLPLRFADNGRLHRYEKSGVVAGLTRVRTFCQDDAHIFAKIEDIEGEVKSLLEMIFSIYEHFDFKDFKIGLSTRPEKRVGDDLTWDKAENALKTSLDKSGFKYFINEGDGAFYGPKIDIQVADALKRYHQLGTIQLDFQLPERFDLTYNSSEGKLERPVVIHRAMLGSYERFIGILIEHVAGAFPFWLAPEQIVIIPVKNELHLDHAMALEANLKNLGYRVRLDDRNESMGLKTRQTQKAKIPFMLVIGDREVENKEVSLRKYGEMQSQTLGNEELFKLLAIFDQEKLLKRFRQG